MDSLETASILPHKCEMELPPGCKDFQGVQKVLKTLLLRVNPANEKEPQDFPRLVALLYAFEFLEIHSVRNDANPIGVDTQSLKVLRLPIREGNDPIGPLKCEGRNRPVEEALGKGWAARVGMGGDDEGNASEHFREAARDYWKESVGMGMDDLRSISEKGQGHPRG